MGRDLPSGAAHGTRLGTAFWAAKLACLLLGLASAALLARVAVPLSRELLLSTLPRLCAAARGYLVPPFIFLVVNFMILVILKLPDTKNRTQRKETPAGAAAAAPAAANPTKLPKDLPHLSPLGVSPNGWSDADSLFASEPASSPKSGDSLSPGWSDESSLTADFEADSAACPPAAFSHNAVLAAVRTSEEPPASAGEDGEEEKEEDLDSMEATWKAITRGEPRRRQLKKNETWSSPPPVRLEPAARRELRKSETFRQTSSSSSSAVATRPVVVERRMNGRAVAVAVAEEPDDLNRQFEAFIKKGKDQMRLQKQESAAQRYMEMANSAGFQMSDGPQV